MPHIDTVYAEEMRHRRKSPCTGEKKSLKSPMCGGRIRVVLMAKCGLPLCQVRCVVPASLPALSLPLHRRRLCLVGSGHVVTALLKKRCTEMQRCPRTSPPRPEPRPLGSCFHFQGRPGMARRGRTGGAGAGAWNSYADVNTCSIKSCAYPHPGGKPFCPPERRIVLSKWRPSFGRHIGLFPASGGGECCCGSSSSEVHDA